MALAYILHQLDPAAISDVVAQPPTTIEEVRAALSRWGKDDPAALSVETWDEFAEQADVVPFDTHFLARCAALGVSSRRTWDLDKAPSRPAFLALFARVRELEPVARVFRSGGWLPDTLGKGDEGLVQIVRDDVLNAAASAAAAWLDDGARTKIAGASGGQLSRLFGVDRRYAAEWAEPHLWTAWCRTAEALATCERERAWLGVEVG